MKIVRTANDGRDYPDEEFLNLPPMSERQAENLAAIVNHVLSGDDPVLYPHHWKAVENDYKLSEPFQS